MPTPLKDLFTLDFVQSFAERIPAVLPKFSVAAYIEAVFTPSWQEMELKARMRHLAVCLGEQLADFAETTQGLLKLVSYLKTVSNSEFNFEYSFLPEYIEEFGLEELEVSIAAMEELTQFVSCEFCIRPFLVRYPDQMLALLYRWAEHPHPMVRRLASEGSRPRLPWGKALVSFKENPQPLLPILESLKNDPNAIVRKSVANNLNDISKDHPDLVISIAKKWLGENPQVNWVVKHGCRTLLKQPNAELMRLFGYTDAALFEVRHFHVQTPVLNLGEELRFSFEVKHKSTEPQNLRLEYAIHYQNAKGVHSRKVYKISEVQLAPNQLKKVERKQSFKPISTRRFYAGTHQVSLLVNGFVKSTKSFELKI